MTASRPILALWAVPRSTSTAFEWMMRVRGDLSCWHEPFGEVWYQGDSPDWPRLGPDSIRTPGLTYGSRWAELQADAERGPVFIKDFPHYLDTLWSDDFFDHFTHSFLIRDPARTVTSMYRHWPDFDIRETGFAEQRRLFDELTVRHGAPPPLIDSDDLLADPAAVVEAWCAAVGIPWLPESLRWEPGPRDEVSWWDGGSFHENLRNSNGLMPQARTSIDLADAPQRVRDVHAELLPHYEHLRAHRIRV
ncbi:MAG: sulfotransferase family protein [Actinomycetota bacterium]